MYPLQHTWLPEGNGFLLTVATSVYGVVYEIPYYKTWRWDTHLTTKVGEETVWLPTYGTKEKAQKALLDHTIAKLTEQIADQQSRLDALKAPPKVYE